MRMFGCVPHAISRPVTDLYSQASQLRTWRAGRVLTAGGRLVRVERRWLGYKASHLRIWFDTQLRPTGSIQCELWYHQPVTNPDFLVLGYVRSRKQTSLATFYCATLVLDEIARLRQCKAIVAEISNDRISQRLLERWGWRRHCESWRGRHYIKRFYDGYPKLSDAWAARLRAADAADMPGS